MHSVFQILRRVTFCFLALFIGASVSAASLTTTFASNNGAQGNMFDVSATSAISITQLDLHLERSANYSIYYRIGSWVGHEHAQGDWTLLQSGTVTTKPMGTGTPVVLNTPFTMQANKTYAFYIYSEAGGVLYTNGSAVGNVYATDGVLTILEGSGVNDFFGNSNKPRVWNGTIHYRAGGVVAVPSMSEWGVLLMSGFLGVFGVAWIRKRRS